MHNHGISLTRVEDIKPYLFGGKAVFTLVSKKTGTRFTYRVRAAEDRERFFFVDLLTGPANTDDYKYIGYIHFRTYQSLGWTFAPKWNNTGGIEDAGLSLQGLFWFVAKVINSDRETIPEALEFWTSGKCSRCGRVLTVPESIEIGMGPVCREKTQQALGA